jgi:heme oxygenase
MQSTRSYLRAATRETHDEIDVIYWSMLGFKTYDSYDRLLQNMLVAYQTLGVPAVRGLKELGDLFPAERFECAISVDRNTQHDAPSIHRTSKISNGQAWGIGYALVGSCAGAKMMINSGHLKSTWKTGYLTAASEFASQGGVANFFRGIDAAQPDVREASIGAHSVFDCLRAPLRREHPLPYAGGHAPSILRGTI